MHSHCSFGGPGRTRRHGECRDSQNPSSAKTTQPTCDRWRSPRWSGWSPRPRTALAVDFLTAAAPSDNPMDLYAAFLSRKGGAQILAKSLSGKTLPVETAKLGIRAIRSSVQDGGGLAVALSKAGNLDVQKKEPTLQEIKALVEEVSKSGDAARGEAVFRRRELQCLACHGIAGAGGQVGPDLTSIGASTRSTTWSNRYLLPNKTVKEGFHSIRVATVEDRVFLGIKFSKLQPNSSCALPTTKRSRSR